MPSPSTSPSLGRLASQWAAALGAWAIPDEIIAGAPESPWVFPTQVFARAARAALAPGLAATPSVRAALEALSAGGTVLDVGAGGGAASLPLAPPAELIVAVDEGQAMLGAFAAAADDRHGVAHREVLGRWPDASGQAGRADVAVCHHVVYNVADLVPFLTALTGAARRRVVIELTENHPQSDLTPLWARFHGLDRPAGPHACDVADIVAALGYDVHVHQFEQPSLWDDAQPAERTAFARRRLCLTADRDAEIAAALDEIAAPRRKLVTLWWPAAAG